MTQQQIVLIVLAVVIILAGIFLAVKGKPSMIRERFASGVSPENERKFMMTIGGAVSVMGLDLLILQLLSLRMKLSSEQTLLVLGAGLVVFVAIILIGQKYYRREGDRSYVKLFLCRHGRISGSSSQIFTEPHSCTG